MFFFFFFQAEDGIRDLTVTGVQTCALPISLHGARCYPSLAALPEIPDCVVVALPREGVEAAVEECAARGVGGVVIYASGYAETGLAERAAEQARLSAIAAAAGTRIVGPNCFGIANNLSR